MITVGVDLAAEAKKTAVARLMWSGQGAVAEVVVGQTDADVVEAVAGATKVGIDCPFGWPEPFIDFITAHRDRGILAPHDLQGRKDLAYRLTDQVIVQRKLGRPLSVSADLIGHAAMRAAGLLAALATAGYDADRTGAGLVVESYPAASLRRWGLPSTQYKEALGAARRGELVDGLIAKAPWLELGAAEAVCRRTDDGLDAVVCALIARAVELGAWDPPTDAELPRAKTEGWIAVPTCELEDLVDR